MDSLAQNYPNPFNPTTKIAYEIADPAQVSLTVYNMLGQKVAVLVEDFRNTGSYSIDFDASELPGGIYICKLQANNFTATKKMVLVK